MRIIVLILAVVVVLGAGAGGAYYYFTSTAEAAIDPDAADQGGHDTVAVTKDHEPDKEVPWLGDVVQFDPLVVPVVDNDGVNQVISLVIGIEVVNGFGVDKVKELTPRLKSAYIKDMYGVLNRHATLKGGVLEVDLIRKRLNDISVQLLGEDVVHGVALQVIQQRPV